MTPVKRSTPFLVLASIFLSSHDTIPTETELLYSPRALPIAMTVCPNLILLELPRGAVKKFDPATLRTATSKAQSLYRTVAFFDVPSGNITVYDAAVSLTTCL